MKNSNFLTADDIKIIFPEIELEPKEHGWILDFIMEPNFKTDCYLIAGAKNKGGSFRCCVRLIYQLINYGHEGVIIRHTYTGHFRTVREIRKMLTLIEQKTNKGITQILKLPTVNTHNFNTQTITCLTNDKRIYFLALEDTNGISNMSNINEVFLEEFIKINIYGNYDKQNQVAQENLEMILNNFSRFDDEKEISNTYFSINPHDYRNFIIKEVYGKLFDLKNPDVVKKLEENYSLVGVLPNFCGRSWTVRHCSVYANWHHLTNQTKKQIDNYLTVKFKLSNASFMVWGFPREDREVGWLYKYDLDLINEIEEINYVPMNIKCGLDIGKLDDTVWCVCSDNRLDGQEIVVLKIFKVPNSNHTTEYKITYLLKEYLNFIKPTLWWDKSRYLLNLFVGSDDYWIEDIIKNIILKADIPLKLKLTTIPKSIKGMLLTERHLLLRHKLLNSKIKYKPDSNINLLVKEMRETVYDGDKISIEKEGNDVKDAFFYANYNHFLFNKLIKLNLFKPTTNTRKLRLSL